MKWIHGVRLAILLIVILLLAAWVYTQPAPAVPTNTATAPQTVTYTCDTGKTITATYGTDDVTISLDNAASTTLQRATTTPLGSRYVADDGSLAFWSEATTSLIMRNNQMDLGYRNCTVQ